MAELTCALAESRIQPQDAEPLLSIFIPTHNRVPEMVQAVESMTRQLHGGLEHKVEILISDNASGPDGREAIRALANRFGAVSYMINAVDQGGHWQVYSAPSRVRGRFTWVFGSDDLIEEGGIADVVRRLEADDPDFLTMDKQIWNRDLSKQLYASANGIPERTFDGFVELFKGVGLHQVAFLGASVEKTEAGRRIDPMKYLTAETMHAYTIAFFEKHQHGKCIYIPDAHVLRRLDNTLITDYMGVVLTDVGMYFPVHLARLAGPYGFSDEVFEQVPGSRFIKSYDPPALTLVDNIFEYQLRSIAAGKGIWHSHRAAFEQMSLNWRPHRRAQFDEIWQLSEKARIATEAIHEARLRHEQLVLGAAAEREALRQKALTFTDKKPV
jgi:glycosyltransferase involved in cell wall biosynthesis